jgi:hypothetical protein
MALYFLEGLPGHKRACGEWKCKCGIPGCSSTGTVVFQDGTNGDHAKAADMLIRDGWVQLDDFLACPKCSEEFF